MDSVRRNEQIVSQIQSGVGDRQELLTELWVSNMGLVQKIIHQATGLQRNVHRQDFEDLEQQAFIGIMEAVRRYDPAAGVKFFTYAESYIRKSIYKYYDKNGQALRLPAYMRKRIKEYTQAKENLRSKGQSATIENIQKILSWSDNAIRSVVETIRKMEMQSLDSYLNESDKDSGTVMDMIASSECVSDDALANPYAEELHIELQKALAELSGREQLVLKALFYQGYSEKTIAEYMGCTRQNISRIKTEAFKQIRTGKYRNTLLSFLSVSAAKRARKKIVQDFNELSEDERNLLL